MVVHLLVLGTIMTHQGPSRKHQIRTGGIKTFIHQEILLLPPKVRDHLLHRGVEIMNHTQGSLAYSTKRTLQRCFIVERLTCIRDEDGGDTQGIVDDEHRRCGIPGRVTASLEGSPDATAGERRSIGFLLHEQLSGELLDHATLTIMLDKCIMFLGCSLRKRLEPVGIVCHTILFSPLLHALCHGIGNTSVERCAIVNHVDEFLIDITLQVFVHLGAVEYILAKVL